MRDTEDVGVRKGKNVNAAHKLCVSASLREKTAAHKKTAHRTLPTGTAGLPGLAVTSAIVAKPHQHTPQALCLTA
jgi:hypothetical protein